MPEDTSKGYRGRLEIVRDVLQVADGGGDNGSKKTHIMYGANLSYKLLTRYLGEVLDAGLICAEGSCYLITDKGKEFLRVYENCEKEYQEIEKHNAKLKSGKEELEGLLVLG